MGGRREASELPRVSSSSGVWGCGCWTAEVGWAGTVRSCAPHGKEFMPWTTYPSDQRRVQRRKCNRDRGKERVFTELAASEHSTTHEGLSVETAQEDRLNQHIKERVSPSFGGPEASSQDPCKVTHNCLKWSDFLFLLEKVSQEQHANGEKKQRREQLVY